MSDLHQQNVDGQLGSLTGDRTGDHDQQYRVGRGDRANGPHPPAPLQRGFNNGQHARLRRLREQAGADGEDDGVS
jgi:hypothetical protein